MYAISHCRPESKGCEEEVSFHVRHLWALSLLSAGVPAATPAAAGPAGAEDWQPASCSHAARSAAGGVGSAVRAGVLRV